MGRKFEAVDLIKLKAQGNTNKWNAFLKTAVDKRDINGLARMLYQLQAGMDDLAKKSLNSEDIVVWYLRLIKSIENTARQIIRIKHPLPQDNPLIAKQREFVNQNEVKKKRDFELASFLRLSSY